MIINDLTLPLKRAVVDHVAADAGVLGLVPYESIYGQTPPAKPSWPFIRLGPIITTPFEAQCWSGITARIMWHAFAETTEDYAAEDYVLQISAAISNAMGLFKPTGIGVVSNRFVQVYSVQDGPEADKWHSISEYRLELHS